MREKLLTISQAADMIGVTIQTLRRWDETGKLSSIRQKRAGHRYYRENVIDEFIRVNIKDIFKLARKWAIQESESDLPSVFYCQDISIFQARLTRLEKDLGEIKHLKNIYPLITAITGEIGNNSFDHNLGNWPDMPGIFFAYDLTKGKIALADRGQGVLKTLKKVKSNLTTHQTALKTAFTEMISGRAPEYRGNGLKFVREVVTTNPICLFFQTGDAQIKIKKDDTDINVNKISKTIQGCLALITF